MDVPFVDLRAQHSSLASELQQAVSAVFQRADFVLGEEVSLFEDEFAAYCEAKYAVGVDSGTSALELALRSFDIGPGDEVITVANTFIATASAVSYCGARPVLVDVDPQTLTIDATRIEEAITERTKAIIPVHLYGHPADMDPVLDIARKHHLIVIEDACQAHGARYKGRRVGSLGHAAAFSFYPAKNLGGCGDGGIILTDDRQITARLRMLRNHGQQQKYLHLLLGHNRRLDTLQAAILRVKLRYLDAWNAARRQHAELYTRLLAASGVTTPAAADYAEPVWHLYVIRTLQREALKAYLVDRGISVGMHYPIPIHLQPAYRDLAYKRGDFPVSEACAEQGLSLPMYAELSAEQIQFVAEAIYALLQHQA